MVTGTVKAGTAATESIPASPVALGQIQISSTAPIQVSSVKVRNRIFILLVVILRSLSVLRGCGDGIGEIEAAEL